MKSKHMSNVLFALSNSIPALFFLLYFIISEPISVILMSFGAILLHELGHLLAFVLTGEGLPSFGVNGIGVRLTPKTPLFFGKALLIYLGGPLCNLVLGLLALRFGKGEFFISLGAIHLLYGIFNLLPFASMDGEKAAACLLPRLFPRWGDMFFRQFRAFGVILFFLLSLFLFYLTGEGLCGLLFVFFYLYGQKKAGEDIF